jgi:hypothetical protein
MPLPKCDRPSYYYIMVLIQVRISNFPHNKFINLRSENSPVLLRCRNRCCTHRKVVLEILLFEYCDGNSILDLRTICIYLWSDTTQSQSHEIYLKPVC